ncbi:hypothetical protein K8R32_05125 [bacterium]|nr:hypothetical protein [bacterium]
MWQRLFSAVILIPFLLLISGCAVGDIARWADNQAAELLDLNKEDVFTPSSDLSKQERGDIEKKSADELTPADREAIDKWLEENGYNRYGDSPGIMYAGGTPLFNEATGKSIDRFDYILKRHPEIFEKINE